MISITDKFEGVGGWRCPALFIFAALVSSSAGAAWSVDEAKLRAVSCEPPTSAEEGKAYAWLNGAEELPGDGSRRFSGDLLLGKACLRNVTFTAGPGAMMVFGEICNARLEDFTAALAAAGITLGNDMDKGEDVEEKTPGFVLGKRSQSGIYLITKGGFTFETTKQIPIKSTYAFNCAVGIGRGN